MDKSEYETFMEALLGADRVVAREFEQKDLFCACQPVEEVARTGMDAARYGAMKPVGLTDPRTGRRPWAVVQLRPGRPSPPKSRPYDACHERSSSPLKSDQ